MASTHYRLVIGNKNPSSWSLRPWLAMKQAGIPFDEIRINLRAPDKKRADTGTFARRQGADPLCRRFDDMGQLGHPRVPGRNLPAGRAVACRSPRRVRSRARFRRKCIPVSRPCASTAPWISWRRSRARSSSSRYRPIFAALWQSGRTAGRGSADRGRSCSLTFSNADAMYAPIASRLKTYVPDLAEFGDDGTARAYIDGLFALPAMKEWAAGARRGDRGLRPAAAGDPGLIKGLLTAVSESDGKGVLKSPSRSRGRWRQHMADLDAGPRCRSGVGLSASRRRDQHVDARGMCADGW